MTGHVRAMQHGPIPRSFGEKGLVGRAFFLETAGAVLMKYFLYRIILEVERFGAIPPRKPDSSIVTISRQRMARHRPAVEAIGRSTAGRRARLLPAGAALVPPRGAPLQADAGKAPVGREDIENPMLCTSIVSVEFSAGLADAHYLCSRERQSES